MPRLSEVVLALRDRIFGRPLRSYDQARDELGGVPWRPFSNTQRWFIPPPPPSGSEPVTLDTGALSIVTPSVLERLRGVGRTGWLVGAGVLAGVLVISLAARGSSAAPAVAAAAAPVAAAAAPAPAAAHAAPAAAPVAQATTSDHPRMSASVRALLNGGASARPSRASHAHVKKSHRIARR